MTIREFRLEKKLSQTELASALGISVSSERQYEYGKRAPSIAVLAKIKEVYGVDLNAPVEAGADEGAKQAQCDAEAAVHAPLEKPAEIIIQSPMGGEITAEEILAKVPAAADRVYIRVDQNAAYWVKGEDSGVVNLW